MDQTRPSYWDWWSTIRRGYDIGITANEWNSFCSRINEVRAYYNVREYSFDRVYRGDPISADVVNAARSAIHAYGPLFFSRPWMDQPWASGDHSYAEGHNTIANQYQCVVGTYNVEKTSSGVSDDRFIVGGGWDSRKNAFRVHSNGNVYGGQYNSSGADYAELFEWADDNSAKEDRAGLFVTLDGEKIHLAGPDDGYILGIVSASPSVVGDVYDDQWAGMYLRDVFGRTVMEMQDFPEEAGPDGEIIRDAHRELAPKLNPGYRPDETYVPRSRRPEWDAVGMMGKLVAVDDGACEPNGYCKVGDGGIATRSDTFTPYRVLSRLDANHIRVLIR